jgi:hypothetical protein
VALGLRQLLGHAERRAAREDGDLRHWVGVLGQDGEERVAGRAMVTVVSVNTAGWTTRISLRIRRSHLPRRIGVPVAAGRWRLGAGGWAGLGGGLCLAKPVQSELIEREEGGDDEEGDPVDAEYRSMPPMVSCSSVRRRVEAHSAPMNTSGVMISSASTRRLNAW